jgi:hypothetical protein
MLFALRIITHLDDKEPPVLIKCEGDGIGNQWLSGDQFEAKPLPELKGVQGLARSH